MNLLRHICHIVSTLLFLLSFSMHGQGQLQAIDSVKSILEAGELNTRQQLESLNWLSTNSRTPNDKLNYGILLLELATKSKDEEHIIRGNFKIGVAYRYLGDLAKAQEFLFKSANDAIENQSFKSYLAEIYTEISTTYTQNGDSENALLYNSKAIDILRETDRYQQLAISLLNTGFDYYIIGNYDSAMSYYNEAEPIFAEIGLKIGSAYLIGNRALVYWKNGDLRRAEEDLFTAIKMLEPLGDSFGMADYYNQLGNIYLEENNKDQAILYTMRGLELAKAEGLKEQVRDASNLLYMIYGERGEYKQALNYRNQYYAYKDSIQNLETTQQLANLRTEFEVGQKQVEVDLLLEQKRSNQIIIITGGIILVILASLIIVILSYSKAKNKLNQQLEEQKDSLLKLNQTKDKFFSVISHDLRGPVNSLVGLVNVTKYFVNGSNERLSDAIDKMGISVDRLNRLLDNLLTWALQQRGHFPYVPENLDLKNMVTDQIEMIKDTAATKNIAIDCQIDEDIPLYADKNSTSTILRNLISNAIKFTPEGGHVQISAEVSSNNHYSAIKVVDDGVGIPKDKLDNLFKLNEKKSTRGTSGETGLGLGLQLVYEFVELNKGKIEVESEPEKGTTFTVLLPHN